MDGAAAGCAVADRGPGTGKEDGGVGVFEAQQGRSGLPGDDEGVDVDVVAGGGAVALAGDDDADGVIGLRQVAAGDLLLELLARSVEIDRAGVLLVDEDTGDAAVGTLGGDEADAGA